MRTTASPQEQEEAILAAATEEFGRVGVRRSNLNAVARRANVSRSTLYRRFPTKEELLYAVVGRLTESIFAELQHHTTGMTAKQLVVEVFCIAVRETTSNPVLHQLMVAEPDTLAALLGFFGPGMSAVLDRAVELAVAQAINAGAKMPPADLRIVVELMIRLTTSLMNSPSAILDADDPAAARQFAQKFFAPMIW
ncbi:TetR/AcrR family transcriptional regulator [Mycobacterium sp. UM_CSW]|uniref:TetR/AcrR family transcriptional regulator n=1 Tax=Mycobacterium sp. UM_CSW TaxID=1370119 RepID=UPI0013767E7B|nr:TetR/AcrR family transcriptional regulator [Mycobacterium sp. UM_CSW]